MRLSRFLARHAGVSVDLDIEYRQTDHAERFRLVVLPGRTGAGESPVYESVPKDVLGRTGRAAVPLPVANRVVLQGVEVRRQFSTNSIRPILTLRPGSYGPACVGPAETLSRPCGPDASATARPISTRRVAMCAHLLLTDLVSALVRGRGLPQAWQHAMEYLLAEGGALERASRTANRATSIRLGPGRGRLSDHP